MTETGAAILLDGVVIEVRLDGDDLVAADGRRVRRRRPGTCPRSSPARSSPCT